MRPPRYALALAAWASAYAHDLYLMPASFRVSPGERFAVEIHDGDSFPESDAPPVLDRLRDFTLYAGKLAYNVTNLRALEKTALGDARAAQKGILAVTVYTAPHVATLQAQEFEKYLREEHLAAALAYRSQHGETALPAKERYRRFAKALIASGDSAEHAHHATGLELEFVAEKNPYALKPGDQMPVRLLWRGKPAAGVGVEVSVAPPGQPGESRYIGRTDAKGHIQVVLNQPGRWRLRGIFMERCSEPAIADWESYGTSLTFEIAAK
jgi:uncharacterized GH25 family protein